ncbi:DUF3871 family protein [uncultured Nonlabens sp.]|uniref:DUF3871 family protein n=1 Tax=uncultured Nonlabens sp. TaxID=859306 RepID=UPI00261151E2|nr:DUF3871 family protein [uncultured Nonlabens sp.]
MSNIIEYNNDPLEMVVENPVEQNDKFIVANTEVVSLKHLKEDCIVPVFTKDNETTISHYQFIDEVQKSLENLMGNLTISEPKIRVSHVIKGRTPSAIRKPVKELLESEKTRYYERLAFSIDIPEFNNEIAGSKLNLSIGGVRAYNQENLYSTKSMEKFKLFIGFKNAVCTNLCISTDGLLSAVRVSSIEELGSKATELIQSYEAEEHFNELKSLTNFTINENQFTFLIGKLRMLPYLDKKQNPEIFITSISDSQASNMIKDFHLDNNFKRDLNGDISLWNLYNILTEANKSSYIDKNFERNVNCFEFVKHLENALKNDLPCWYLN